MPKKKVTIVDIKDNDNENANVDDVNVTVDEKIETEQVEKQPEKQSPLWGQPTPVVEKQHEGQPTPVVEKQPEKQPEPTPVQPDKVVREQELIPCPKCGKMLTSKT